MPDYSILTFWTDINYKAMYEDIGLGGVTGRWLGLEGAERDREAGVRRKEDKRDGGGGEG